MANFSHRQDIVHLAHYPMSIGAIDPLCPQAILPVMVTLIPSVCWVCCIVCMCVLCMWVCVLCVVCMLFHTFTRVFCQETETTLNFVEN